MDYFKECVKNEDPASIECHVHDLEIERVQKVLRVLRGTPEALIVASLVSHIERLHLFIKQSRIDHGQLLQKHESDFHRDVANYRPELFTTNFLS